MKSKQKKVYFILQSADNRWPGHLDLGRIIESPHSVATVLNPDGLLRIDTPVTSITKQGSEISLGQEKKGEYAMFARFLSQAYGKVTIGHESKTEDKTISGELETRYFQPSDVFVKKCLESDGIKKYLAKHGTKKSMYMITGLKIAKQANSSNLKQNSLATSLSGGLDTGHGVGFGGAANFSSSNTNNVSFANSDDYVFALRIRRIHIEKGGEVSTSEVGGGDLYSVGTKDRSSKETIESEDFEFIGMRDQDVPPGEFNLEALTTIDEADDEECSYVVI